MSKDGTMRGGRRPRSGERPQPLVDKISAGKKTKRMEVDNFPDIDLLVGDDIGEGVELEGNYFPEPSEYLSAKQKDGTTLGADAIYRDVFDWLHDRGSTSSLPHEWLKATLRILLVSCNVKPH